MVLQPESFLQFGFVELVLQPEPRFHLLFRELIFQFLLYYPDFKLPLGAPSTEIEEIVHFL